MLSNHYQSKTDERENRNRLTLYYCIALKKQLFFAYPFVVAAIFYRDFFDKYRDMQCRNSKPISRCHVSSCLSGIKHKAGRQAKT